MAPKRKSSSITRGESSAPPTDIHPRRMRLRSWTNLRPTPTTRISNSSIVRPSCLRDPVPIIIDSSDSKDSPSIINSTDSKDNFPIPEPNLSFETEFSSEPKHVPSLEPIPTLGIHLC